MQQNFILLKAFGKVKKCQKNYDDQNKYRLKKLSALKIATEFILKKIEDPKRFGPNITEAPKKLSKLEISRIFPKNLRENSHYCLILNEINCKQKKWGKSKKKLISKKFLTNEKL